jgi:hypothetical protein
LLSFSASTRGIRAQTFRGIAVSGYVSSTNRFFRFLIANPRCLSRPEINTGSNIVPSCFL